MKYDWSPLKAELAQWRSHNRALPLWWRDDDAIAPTAALDQLGMLSTALRLPVHLAIIPKFSTVNLAHICQKPSPFIPLVHGWAHENQTIGTGKKAEFGFPRTDAKADLTAALVRMDKVFGESLLRMFVPPWNRITPDLVTKLHGIGYEALSTFTPRTARFAAPGLVQINTHIDPIFWRGGGGLVDPDALIQCITKLLYDRRMNNIDPAEPLGFLTHHLVHTPDIWAFTESCLGTLLDGGATPVNLPKLHGRLP